MTDEGMLKRISAACTLIVLIGLADMPYGYYTILKISLFAASIATMWICKSRLHEAFIWLCGIAAVIYNPLIPIRFGDKEIWILINFATLALIWAATFALSRKARQTQKPEVAARVSSVANDEGLRDTLENDMILVEPASGSLADKLAGITIKSDCAFCKSRFSFISGAIPFFKNRQGAHYTLCKPCLYQVNVWRSDLGLKTFDIPAAAYVD